MIMRVLFFFLMSMVAYGQVQIAGKAKNVMMGIDLSSNIWLDTIVQLGVYGLGPVDDLQGEITLIDGVVHASSVVNGEVRTHHSPNVKAPFFVYAHVEEWEAYEISVEVHSMSDLQHIIEDLAQSAGMEGPFPFRIKGNAEYLKYHIIMRDLGEKAHSHEAHKKAKVQMEQSSVPVECLGFFSREHEGVFTHKGQYIHVHVVLQEPLLSAHVDNISAMGKLVVFLPKMQ
jgi:acetolactate decarboxylase